MPRWHGRRVLALDGSTLRVPDVPECADSFGGMHTYCGRFRPLARASALLDVARGAFVDAALGGFGEDERALARQHLPHLGPQDLLLMDRGYPSREWFAELATRGVAFCARISERTWSAVARFARGRRNNDAAADLGTPGAPLCLRLLRVKRPDPDFDRKMHEVLIVYRDVSLYTEGAVHDGRPNPIYTVSVDEKPGIQAIGLTAPDLPPAPSNAPTVSRDYEYIRHGTVSILAGIDLYAGHLFAHVEDRHRSREFIALLQSIDAYYPPEAIIRVVLDNPSSHISKETMAYLATRPGRFEDVHTPKHGSWLNLSECAFSKMARTFLRHIRVASTPRTQGPHLERHR